MGGWVGGREGGRERGREGRQGGRAFCLLCSGVRFTMVTGHITLVLITKPRSFFQCFAIEVCTAY